MASAFAKKEQLLLFPHLVHVCFQRNASHLTQYASGLIRSYFFTSQLENKGMNERANKQTEMN